MCCCVYLQDSVSDLTSMQLSANELANRISSRQSRNLNLARAELLERSRNPRHPLPPALAARLRAATSQVSKHVKPWPVVLGLFYLEIINNDVKTTNNKSNFFISIYNQ